MSKANKMLALERRSGGAVLTSQLLGVDTSLYYKYTTGKRAVPAYIQHSIQAHLLLTDADFEKLLKKRA